MLPEYNRNRVDQLDKQNIIEFIDCNYDIILDIIHIFLLMNSKLEYNRDIYCRNQKWKRAVQVDRQHSLRLLDLIEESHLDRRSINLLFRSDKVYHMSIVGNKSLSKLGDR